ncbi:MAG: addiction module protein [Thermoanaerobaculia bacterium]|nr:addiction module protein [Thermoanaerobaculia bacterium]
MEVDVFAEARRLTVEERLELIEVLWDSLSSGDVPVTADDTRTLDERIGDLESHPGDESSWDEVRTHLASRRP